MSNIDPPAGWDDVPELLTTQRALAGPGGPLNVPLVALTARTKQLRDDQSAATAALSGADGAALIGFDQGTASSVPWDLRTKLRTEVRNVLDFIPQAQKAAVLAGTSTWDASTAINKAIVELGGGEIIVPKGARLALAAPIDLQRGTFLRGAGTFDTMPGVGCKFFLLPGSNCPMLRTPLAAGTGVATHFMGVENLLFDGNKANQTAESIAMQFYGAFVGSWLRNVCMLNTLGPAIVMQGGTDVDVSHLWIVGSTVADGYAFDTNLDLSGSSLSGLLQMDNVYIENTGIDKTIDPKTNPETRGKNARLRRLASAYIASLHTEGAVNALDIDQCHTVRIGKITGANIGNATATDPALVRYINANTRAVSIGTMFLGQVTGTPALIRKATGVTSNYLQDVPYTTNPYVVGYEAQNDRLNGSKRQLQTSFANQAFVTKNGGFSTIGWFLYQADPDDTASARSGLIDAGLGPKLTSSIGQPSNTLKDFLSVVSTGNALDRILLSDPLLVGARTTAADIPAGCVYRMSAATVGGTALVYQRAAGANVAADTVVTAQRGAATPTANADYLGQVFLDLSAARRAYIAVNTGTGASDWKPITA